MTSRLRIQSPADFMFGTTLGEGAYARVVHARLKETNEEFAVKIMEKRFISKEKKVKFVMMERKVFSKVSHERIVKLSYSFQDKNYLYMVMELCRGGELLDVIVKSQKEQAALGNANKACSFEVTQFYIAEVIEALEYLHGMGIIHRDIKPENILLNDAGHLKITDFGTAKDETEDGVRHNTFCGTAEFVSPEVLRDQEASRGCDLWAVGCMIYQMLVGRPMFRAENEYLTFQQILNHPAEDFAYPDGFPDVAKDLCDKLLLQDPAQRLGSGTNEEGNGYDALKSHPFFEGIDWAHLGQTQSPYVPKISNLPPTDNDGATEDWLFAGVATELQISSGLHAEPIVQYEEDRPSSRVLSGSNHNNSQRYIAVDHHNPVEVARVRATVPPPPVSRMNSLWNRFLLDDEVILMSGLVSKRKGLFSKKRQLILTSKPRLIYIDAIRMRQKGEIPWSDSMYITLKNSTAFDVVTPNRVYHLTDPANGAKKWSDAINASLVQRKYAHLIAFSGDLSNPSLRFQVGHFIANSMPQIAPWLHTIQTPISINKRSVLVSVFFCFNLISMPFKAYLSELSPFQPAKDPTHILQPNFNNATFESFAQAYLTRLETRYNYDFFTPSSSMADYTYDPKYEIDIYRKVVAVASPMKFEQTILYFPTAVFYPASQVHEIKHRNTTSLPGLRFASYVTLFDLTQFIQTVWVVEGNSIAQINMTNTTGTISTYTIYHTLHLYEYLFIVLCLKFGYRCLLSLYTMYYFYHNYYASILRLLKSYKRTPLLQGASRMELIIGEPTDFVVTNPWITMGFVIDCLISLQFAGRAISRACNFALAPFEGCLALLYLSRLVWFAYMTMYFVSKWLLYKKKAHLFVPLDTTLVAILSGVKSAIVVSLVSNIYPFFYVFNQLMNMYIPGAEAQYQVDSTIGVVLYMTFVALAPIALGFTLSMVSRHQKKHVGGFQFREKLRLWAFGIPLIQQPRVFLSEFLLHHPECRINCTLSQDDEECFLVIYDTKGKISTIQRLLWMKTLNLGQLATCGSTQNLTTPLVRLIQTPSKECATIELGNDDLCEWIY